ncbi:MAG TPA: ParB N-terminal domain-containing protein, partial [Baekduia sp.]|nr:ParB N-terminal domain-containing protein [Baekduia sp.]
MSTPTMTTRRVEEILVEQIEAGGNVRDLDGEHVSRLAASMKVRGLLTPIDVVAVDGERFALVAGARPARRPAPRRGPVARRARRPAHSPRRSRTRSTAQRAGQPVDRLALALGTRVHVDLGARDARVPKHRLRDVQAALGG